LNIPTGICSSTLPNRQGLHLRSLARILLGLVICRLLAKVKLNYQGEPTPNTSIPKLADIDITLSVGKDKSKTEDESNNAD